MLIYYRELERLRVSHEGSMILMTYVFSVSARWIEEVLRTNDISDYEDVELEHLDLDIKQIDMFVQKLHRLGKNDRKQLALF